MKVRSIIVLVLLAMATVGCNNFFHELIPPDGNRIESFYIPGQLGAAIGDTSITVTVPPGMALSRLVPSIQVSAGATLFPVTYEYTARTFGDESIFGVAMELYTSGTNTEKVMELIRTHKDNFAVPALDMPINFGYPVDFLVISGLGTMRRYTVRIEVDTGEGKFLSFKFDKFFNPDMVRTAAGSIDTSAKTVTIDISYPVENIALYQLTPSFATNGARVYLDNGTELTSDVSLMDFLKPPDSSDLINPLYASQTTTLTLKRAGYADSVWTLTVNFSEDPDTNRSIIDFRFTKALNPLISADYMAETIYGYGDSGIIRVTVYYSGAKPEELRASFVSPGTVTVGGNQQFSGFSTQDFSAPLQYVVTSKVGGFIRTYNVTVNLLPISDPLPQITYFSFRMSQNPLLVSNSTAIIDHNSRFILIEAAYDGDTPPVNLIPEFSATGTVTVNGVTQNSNYSMQDFSGPVGYMVTHPFNPTLKREYRVEVHFVKNLSSVAEITEFSFYRADNPGLVADVRAAVNQAMGTITATLLFETPGGDRTLVPRWSAQGRVESGGVTQTSGVSGRQFYTPQGYRAVSVDGIIRKDYTVTIREVNSRIYVKHDATGRNDGTNWQNAYRSVYDANSDARQFYYYPAIMKEVWIAEGTYAPGGTLYVDPNTSYIGGFRGGEASVSARVDPVNHRATITGDLGGGRRLGRIFYSFSDFSGVCDFENLILTSAGDGTANGAGIYADEYGTTLTLLMKDLDLTDFRGIDGGAVYLNVSSALISDTTIKNVEAKNNGGGIYLSTSLNVVISNTIIENAEAYAGGGICGEPNSFTISGSVFRNTKARGAGGGMRIGENTQTIIEYSLFENCTAGTGGGVCFGLFNTDRTTTITNTTFVNCTAANECGGISFGEKDATITNTEFINCTSQYGIKIFDQNNNSTIKNCTFIHNSNLPNLGPSTSGYKAFFGHGGTFEGCTFTNLRSSQAGENYLFDVWRTYPGSNGGGSIALPNGKDIILRNCTFNFNAGSAGLCALYSGSLSNNGGIFAQYLLMDGVTINNSGGQQPLIWLNGSLNSPFRFRANNVYNGTTLNTPAAITSLGTGVIRLQNGAVPTMVP